MSSFGDSVARSVLVAYAPPSLNLSLFLFFLWSKIASIAFYSPRVFHLLSAVHTDKLSKHLLLKTASLQHSSRELAESISEVQPLRDLAGLVILHLGSGF